MLAALIVLTFALPQPSPATAPQTSLVSEVARFQLHSAFWPNLHHTLYAAAWSRRPAGSGRPGATPLPEPLTGDLTNDERAAWDAAVDYYDRELASRDLLFGDGMTAINETLASAAADLPDAGLTPAHRQALVAAAPVYRKYWWSIHDRANRAWIADAATRVTQIAPDVTQRLSALYGMPWFSSGVRVDVVRAGKSQGAYTSLRPTLITVSSGDRDLTGWTSAEILFHEASHALIDQISRRIRDEAHGKNVRDLWHVVLFFTVGEVVKQTLAAKQIDYAPYLYSTGLFDRAWPQYREPIEREWRPYVDSRVPLEAAVKGLVSAVP